MHRDKRQAIEKGTYCLHSHSIKVRKDSGFPNHHTTITSASKSNLLDEQEVDILKIKTTEIKGTKNIHRLG